MVTTDPSVNQARRFKEALIRIVDLVSYATVLAAGIFALWFTPDSVKVALAGFGWLIVTWGVLLVAGGTLGFTGRLSRIWVIEIPGASAGIAGAAIYFVILGTASITSSTALVAVTLVACMMLLLLRRYIELQIFTSEPGDLTIQARIRLALKRRTTNTAGQHR